MVQGRGYSNIATHALPDSTDNLTVTVVHVNFRNTDFVQEKKSFMQGSGKGKIQSPNTHCTHSCREP